MSDEKKEIKVIAGDGNELNISEVSTHLNVAKPKLKDDKNKQIVIPKANNNSKK